MHTIVIRAYHNGREVEGEAQGDGRRWTWSPSTPDTPTIPAGTLGSIIGALAREVGTERPEIVVMLDSDTPGVIMGRSPEGVARRVRLAIRAGGTDGDGRIPPRDLWPW